MYPTTPIPRDDRRRTHVHCNVCILCMMIDNNPINDPINGQLDVDPINGQLDVDDYKRQPFVSTPLPFYGTVDQQSLKPIHSLSNTQLRALQILNDPDVEMCCPSSSTHYQKYNDIKLDDHAINWLFT
jgi:hypothetical protein